MKICDPLRAELKTVVSVERGLDRHDNLIEIMFSTDQSIAGQIPSVSLLMTHRELIKFSVMLTDIERKLKLDASPDTLFIP